MASCHLVYAAGPLENRSNSANQNANPVNDKKSNKKRAGEKCVVALCFFPAAASSVSEVNCVSIESTRKSCFVDKLRDVALAAGTDEDVRI